MLNKIKNKQPHQETKAHEPNRQKQYSLEADLMMVHLPEYSVIDLKINHFIMFDRIKEAVVEY